MDKNTSEIAKLTERISRDPKSKLFVPLAEEYKKSGDIEMAVHVLTEGLKNNPGYVTARTFLGRLLFDMGDMAAARREFEEVVKAVPDNLLAQKKLGDLHALLGSQTEALNYYKKARSLNPADEEIRSLVSDLEAGIDVKPRIMKHKASPAPEPPAAAGPRSALQQKKAEPEKRETPAEPAGNTGIAGLPGPGEEAAEEETPAVVAEDAEAAVTGQATPSAVVQEPDVSREGGEGAATGEVPPATVAREEPEIAEEVLVVEPLEEESPPDEAPAAPLDEVPVFPEEPEAAVERTGDVSDDFTTDTLAELYISQGFYEKAIDIYERMVADHPDSGALKDKLERVRLLASTSEAGAAQTSGTTAAASGETMFDAAPEAAPSAAPDAGEEGLILEADLVAEPEETLTETAQGGPEDLFGEPKEYIPPPPEAEGTAEREEEKFFDAVMHAPAREFAGTETGSTAFEPREYRPPEAESGKGAEEEEGVERKPAETRRKEVIGRLENWLRAIKKEN